MPEGTRDGDGHTPPEGRRVADRLNALFAMVNSETGRPYTNAEVARATGISASAIAQLRQGAKPNPTLKTIEALASYFGVTTDYFSKGMSDERVSRIVAALQMLDTAEKAGVEGLFARASGLSADSLRTITAVIETARRAEGLDSPNSG
ncbi:helix-turn-helix transcriptional regulator [Streptomyces sp. RLB3-5]|uniref:helix-turn-helix domain-containing protein n=1 Tax=unclassified Streptomyces TaxID=2593676 RepID=UPI00116260F3|nr:MULTISPECIES: helix-turn-helix transcriptional regulator [unclassified Streptomyces]QDO51665.1 helix-turn-helix transcriptional regulator [Streptomyces sp. RLB3-5]QDO61906.1 helix-turn-helix transcriptional regulator [Streptomyces sp. RLB1-8]